MVLECVFLLSFSVLLPHNEKSAVVWAKYDLPFCLITMKTQQQVVPTGSLFQ